jgi:hypothetical protein
MIPTYQFKLSQEAAAGGAPTEFFDSPMKLFVGLQLADAVTTMIFLSMGLAESNPLVSALIGQFGALGGVLLIKGFALAIACLCRLAARPSFFRRLNIVYAAIVGMNLLTIFTAHRH